MHELQLACKSCGKAIPAADVNIDKAIAKCQACNAVFGILDVVTGSRKAKGSIAASRSIQVDAWGPELTLTKRWYSHGLWALLLFCIFWDGFLVIWYSIGIRGLFSGQDNAGFWPAIVMLVFPVFHVAVGVTLTYAVIGGFFNRTIVRVAGGELSVWHGPIPWPGNQRLFTADVQQLYCTESPTRKRDGSKTYNVLAVTGKNDEVTLITGLEQLDDGLFIEQQIEQHLKIPDQRMPGEVRL